MNIRYWIERGLAFLFIAIVVLTILWPERSYVPIWDGRVYADCAVNAAQRGLSMQSLRCAGHPSQGYAVFLALSQLVRLGDVRLLFAVNALLGIGALLCIRLLLARLFPGGAFARSLDLVTLACAVHPVVLSTLLQVNIDFGVYVFFFAALAALAWRRYALVAIAGVLLCFSKETGALVYGVMIALWALFEWVLPAESVMARTRRLLPLWPTVVPLALFALHVLTFTGARHESAIWKQGWQRGSLDGFVWFDFSEPVFRSYAAGILLLGFMWVVTAVITADLIVGGTRLVRRQSNREVPGADRRLLSYLIVLTALIAYLLTAFRTWSNLRYFALLYPLLVLLSYVSLVRLRVGSRVRNGMIAAVTLLFALATFRSVDPVSRVVYGTFSTGDREMYRMASITGEYHGPGRDQLVYNLEFTGYHAVQNTLFRQLRPTDSTAIATGREARWNIFSPLNAVTLRRTLRTETVVMPRYWDDESLRAAPESARPRELWYLDFSYRPDADTSLRTLAGIYHETAVVRASVGGHTIVAHRLEIRTP